MLLANTLYGIAMVLQTVLEIYFWIVLISCILSWVNPDPYNTIVQAIRRMTEPVFIRVLRLLPFTYTSSMDFSPVVVLLAIKLVENIVVRTLIQYAASF